MTPCIVILNNERSLTLRQVSMHPNSGDMVRMMADAQEASKDRGR